MNIKVPLTLLALSVLSSCGQVAVVEDKPLPRVKVVELGESIQKEQMFFPSKQTVSLVLYLKIKYISTQNVTCRKQ